MRILALVVTVLLSAGASAADGMRPQVPVAMSTVAVPSPVNIAVAEVTVTVGGPVNDSGQNASVGIPAVPKPGSESAPVSIPQVVTPDVASVAPISAAGPSKMVEADAVQLAFMAEDEAGLRDALVQCGLALRDVGASRELPAFLTGVDSDEIMSVDAPAGGALAIRSDYGQAVSMAAGRANGRFVLVVDAAHVTGDVLKLAASPNVAAVIVGHGQAFDDDAKAFPQDAADVNRVVAAVRLVSDAPVLLAVSPVGRRMSSGRAWAAAFGESLAAFDGWAVYNVHQFPAILESPTNPRKAVLAMLGLPDKPCVLLDFIGGPVTASTDGGARLKAAWHSKGGALVKALKEQGWRGVIVYAARSGDAAIKSAALGQ